MLVVVFRKSRLILRSAPAKNMQAVTRHAVATTSNNAASATVSGSSNKGFTCFFRLSALPTNSRTRRLAGFAFFPRCHRCHLWFFVLIPFQWNGILHLPSSAPEIRTDRTVRPEFPGNITPMIDKYKAPLPRHPLINPHMLVLRRTESPAVQPDGISGRRP